MPLFEYHCKCCGGPFEALVRGDEAPLCPHCGAAEIERRLSLFAVGRSAPVPLGGGACGTCGDPRGPGACRLD